VLLGTNKSGWTRSRLVKKLVLVDVKADRGELHYILRDIEDYKNLPRFEIFEPDKIKILTKKQASKPLYLSRDE